MFVCASGMTLQDKICKVSKVRIKVNNKCSQHGSSSITLHYMSLSEAIHITQRKTSTSQGEHIRRLLQTGLDTHLAIKGIKYKCTLNTSEQSSK